MEIFSAKDYSPEVKSYIKSVKKYIQDTQQCIPEEYSLPLRLLADNYERYLKCIEALKTEGTVYKSQRDGRQFINPLYRVCMDCQSNIQSILKQFGLTTFSRSKIRLQDAVTSPESLIDNLLQD